MADVCRPRAALRRVDRLIIHTNEIAASHMRHFQPNTDEVVLIQQKCLQMRGPLGHAGELILTNQRLKFIPTGALQRITGAKDVETPLEQITGTRTVMHYLSTTYEVTFGAAPWRFWGEGARRVHQRLLPLPPRCSTCCEVGPPCMTSDPI